MNEPGQSAVSVPRRQALCSLVALGLVSSAALAACSTEEKEPSSSGAPNDGAAAPLAQLSTVPVGGGRVVTAPDGRSLVVTQPAAGTVVAYDASCTHKGVPVGAPDSQGLMTCAQHNSKFRIADGSVVSGPATTPLRTVAVTVDGNDIKLA